MKMIGGLVERIYGRISKLIFNNIQYPILLGIILLGIWLRLINWDPNNILDYDPWWFFRHAQEILNNGFLPLKWDILSYYPPGRPTDYYLGWSYTIAIFYKLTTLFVQMKLETFAGMFVAIFASLSAIPAYFMGVQVTNRWGGLVTAFFAIATITFLTVSIGGYPDSDATYVFYTFLCIAATLYSIKKTKNLPLGNLSEIKSSMPRFLLYVWPALLSYWLFAVNWSNSWYIYYIFVFFIPMLIFFRLIEAVIKREHKIGLAAVISKIREHRNLIFTVLFIGFAGEIICLITSGWPFSTIPPHDQLIQGLNIIGTKSWALAGFVILMGLMGAVSGLAFGRVGAATIGGLIGIAIAIILVLSGITGKSLIVNQSVAELQPLDVFTQFDQVVARVGQAPMFFAFVAFVIIGLKMIFKKEIHTAEYFAIIWMIISLFLITKGIRFSLLFSTSVAAAAGFAAGNLIIYARQKGSNVLLGSFFAVFLIASLMFLDGNYQYVKQASGGLDVSQNWRDALTWLKENVDKDSLISTWWDPGHIITGSTGLKVMADGAHCGPSCLFLNHDARIQDMGRAFAISNENESVRLLSRYRGITEKQCEELKKTFKDRFDPRSCEPITDMYVLATADLIGKYYWLSYFGTGQGASFIQCGFNQQETQRLSAPTYVCSAGMEISIIQQNTTLFAIMNSPHQGVRNAPISRLLLYRDGNQIGFTVNRVGGEIDGMVLIDPSFQNMIFMQPAVRDSIFTNMFFFDGKGAPSVGIPPLKTYKLVYSNPEVKIFKVDFDAAGIGPVGG
jgi:dolichyl-diphosphooligosaccharide--protein glycosyltransferase